MEYKKISVLIVTYRQADVIGRNIESIIRQKEFGLHEIVICDDCSPDNNWEVIQSYVKKYPNIIRAYRNERNLGIYGNSDKCASLHGDADLFCWVEGDDALCDGFFKTAQDAIINQNINVNERIAIQADFISINSNGNKIRHDNSFLSNYKGTPNSVKIRSLTTWRASLFSKSVIECFKPTILDRGLALAESLFDGQWFSYTDKFYYINCVGSIYYSGIGVSVGLGFDSPFKGKEALEKWTYHLESGAFQNKQDIYWIKFLIAQSKFVMNRNTYELLRCFYYFSKGRFSGNKFTTHLAPLLKLYIHGK